MRHAILVSVLLGSTLSASSSIQIAASRALPAPLQRALDSERAEPAALHALTQQLYVRVGAPVWVTPDAAAAARMWAAAMDDAPREGLPRSRFASDADIEAWLGLAGNFAADADARAVADVRLTRAILDYAAVLARGWDALGDPASSARDVDVAAIVANARDPQSVRLAVDGLAPRHREYRDLRRLLIEYRDLASRPPPAPLYPADVLLKRGAGDADSATPNEKIRRAVGILAQRLALPHALPPDAALPADGNGTYTAALEAAVRAFQRAHGLAVDGVVGSNTAAALNTTPADRVAQIAVNMDRWRRLPDDMGGRQVRVNIPAFALELREHDVVTQRMRVVAGSPAHRTPIFHDAISYLVFRPYWNIPASIARNEILPKAADDPSYMDSRNIQVIDGWSSAADPIDPLEVDWESDAFPYRLRQGPGRGNALGLVKFMFPNRHHVYLHDTNAPWLFAQDNRARSHGCVRVEHPAQLAAALLRPQGWTLDGVENAMQHGSRRVVTLDEKVPVYLQYQTVAVDEEGAVRFFPDVYGRDARVITERQWSFASEGRRAYGRPEVSPM